MIEHDALVQRLEAMRHEKVGEKHWRVHHGKDQHDARKLHALFFELGYYPAGRDHTIKDAWAAFSVNHPNQVSRVGVHRKTDPNDSETHFTDIVFY